MKRLLLASMLMLAALPQAQAGFVTGYLVGSAGNTTSSASQPVFVSSDTHDVILCPKVYEEEVCRSNFGDPNLKPLDYAKRAGYSKVIKVSAMVSNGTPFIVMEVEKAP